MRRDRFVRFFAVTALAALLLHASDLAAQATAAKPAVPGMPADPKALKTYESALQMIGAPNHGKYFAIEAFRKANKQDGGHCSLCLQKAFTTAVEINEFKQAEEIAREAAQLAIAPNEKSIAHFYLGFVLSQQGLKSKKDSLFEESAREFREALKINEHFAVAHFNLGLCLGHLQRDDEAKAEFATYITQELQSQTARQRAQKYIDNIALTRAKLAPAFSVTALDGSMLSLDALAGKVVLIDFWATWCPPCREALPHVQQIAKQFAGEPFTVVSISLDTDDAAWRKFIAKNQMNWPQFRDGRFDGPIAKAFEVNAIPATFTIDSDGVLEDQHVGDANVENKLKKLIARARELQSPKSASTSPAPAVNSN